LLKEAKKVSPDASFIILTARGDLEDRIKGLDLGADDYMAKPFSLLELQARMQAITRRKSGINEARTPLGDFTIDLNKRMVLFQETEIDLSRKEFDLLSYLLLHKNRPLTRMQLSEHIWGSFTDDDYDSNFIDVHIKNIRKKMSVYGSVDWLQTIRGHWLQNKNLRIETADQINPVHYLLENPDRGGFRYAAAPAGGLDQLCLH
jgi:DNA-binding response OmpR family regulator